MKLRPLAAAAGCAPVALASAIAPARRATPWAGVLPAVLVALHAAPGIAATDASMLEEVIVTAKRIQPRDFATGALRAESIAAKRPATSDTARLLGDVPGVHAYGAGGVSSLPVIRGLADDRLRTKVDGMDVASSCPNHMNAPLSYIDPTAVEEIQVYAGVTPVSVGGDSIGGSIVVQSAPAGFAAPGKHLLAGEAGTFYRGNGAGRGGNLSATLATDSVSVNYAGAYAESDNYLAGGDFKNYTFTGRPGHTLDEDEVGSTAYESSNQSVTLATRGRNQLLEFTYGRQDIPYQAYPNQRMDMTDNVNDQFNLAYTLDQSWGTLEARAYYQDTNHEMDFGDDKRFWYGPGKPPAGSGGDTALDGSPCSPISGVSMTGGMMLGCAAGMPMKTEADNTGLLVSAAIPLAGSDLLRLGTEYLDYQLDDRWAPSGAGMWPYTFLNINDGKRDRYAAFGEWEMRQERWMHIVGVRYEAVETDAGPVHGYNTATHPTSGTGGMGNQTRDAALFNAASRDRSDDNWDLAWLGRFTPDATQSYEIGLAQKTRSPNLYERYAWSTWQMAALMNNFVGDGNGYVGSPDLDPEVARTASVSAEWHDAGAKRWSVTVTPYYTDVKDYIDAMQWNSTTNAPNTVPVVDNFTVLRFANQSAKLYGVDLSADYQLARGTRIGDIAARLVSSYARGENKDTGDDLYNIMPLNARLILTQSIGAWRNTLEGEFVAEKDDVSRVRNEMQTSSYGLAHLRSGYERESWRADIGIENLFDRSYDAPLGGAYVGQGTTMTIPPAPNEPRWGTPVPGQGRSIYAGVTLKF